MRLRLTDEMIAQLAAGESDSWIGDADSKGLRLRITVRGVRSWSLVYRPPGQKPRTQILGHWPEVTVEEARALAAQARRALRRGEELHATRTKESRLTLGDLLQRFASAQESAVSHKTTLMYGTYRRALRKLLQRQLDTISKQELAVVLSKMAPVLANRCLAHVRAASRWATSIDLLDRDVTAGMRRPTHERPRDRVLSAEEVQLLRQALEPERWRPRLAVMLMLTLAQRVGEVLSMEWKELKFTFHAAGYVDRCEWVIPATKRKTRVGHVVPVPFPVLDLICEPHGLDPRTKDLQVRRPLGRVIGLSLTARTQWQRRLCKRAESLGVAPFELRDLRRTAATGMARLGTPRDVVQKILGHAAAGVTGRVYERHGYLNEMRTALTAWSGDVLDLPAVKID